MFLKPLNQQLAILGLVLLSSSPFLPHSSLQKCDVVITIERESCFGDCPVYSAAIHADGTVVYVGKSNVREIGERRFKISKEKIQQLIEEFQRSDYFSLKDKYETDENGMSVTDQPTTTTSICLKGKKKRVVDYYCAPKELKQLEDKIESLTGLHSFVALGQITTAAPDMTVKPILKKRRRN